LGYGDGVPRAATNRGPVLAAGRIRTVSGTVCMDQFMVDVGEDPVEAGEYAVLFGAGADEPSAEDWAAVLDTIPYEILTRIGARVPRVYTGPGAREAGCPRAGRTSRDHRLGVRRYRSRPRMSRSPTTLEPVP